MKPTGNVCRTDNVQQRRIIAHFPWAKAFAHVRVQIDCFLHSVSFPSRPVIMPLIN